MDFPRADINELISPIVYTGNQGRLKDHLVAWVEDIFVLTHGRLQVQSYLSEIDARYEFFPPC